MTSGKRAASPSPSDVQTVAKHQRKQANPMPSSSPDVPWQFHPTAI
ncbi:hypothetical protein GWI33_010853, partial [Rhynchophorus ferrugineus]